MFFVHNIFEEKPDHPMFSVAEAKKLLAKLPQANPHKALDEVASWLETLKVASGFRPEVRCGIIMLLDETGQPFYSELLHLYLGQPHLQDFPGMKLWQALHRFAATLGEAYVLCAQEYQSFEKKPVQVKEQLPVICVRLMRAATEQLKLEMIRYADVEPSVWERLFYGYNFALSNHIHETLVFPYARQPIHVSPQRELLRGLVLYKSSPGTLAQDQIEACFRIADRMANSFDFKESPDSDCHYYIDLAKPGEPRTISADIRATGTMRFYGTSKALPRIADAMRELDERSVPPEQRVGSEFTPGGKLTVLKHLHTYWGANPPHRHELRRAITTAIDIVHSFITVSKLVTQADIGNAANLSEEDAAMLKERSNITLVGAEVSIDYATETWTVFDISLAGIGCVVPKRAGDWVKVGDLCGLRTESSQVWWVGMIRRLHTDPDGTVRAGIEMLARKPLAVWLRTLGKGAEYVSDWQTSSGSFTYDYTSVILLPDANNSFAGATILMESGRFVPNGVYEVMLGEKSRNIKLTNLLAEGDDYEQASFQWLDMRA